VGALSLLSSRSPYNLSPLVIVVVPIYRRPPARAAVGWGAWVVVALLLPSPRPRPRPCHCCPAIVLVPALPRLLAIVVCSLSSLSVLPRRRYCPRPYFVVVPVPVSGPGCPVVVVFLPLVCRQAPAIHPASRDSQRCVAGAGSASSSSRRRQQFWLVPKKFVSNKRMK
jgi:hypothetical protein